MRKKLVVYLLAATMLFISMDIGVLATGDDGMVNNVEKSVNGESEGDKESAEEILVGGNDSEVNAGGTVDGIDGENVDSDKKTEEKDSDDSVYEEDKIEEENDVGKLEDDEPSILENVVDTENISGNDLDVSEENVIIALADGIVDGGQCGDNLTWSLTSEGTLTISGTGEMWNYYWDSRAPWENYVESLNNLVINEGVTSIGSEAFSGCSGFSGSLIIPKGVTNIGGAAFSDCSGFSGSLTIPESVTSIGRWAFSGCSGFKGSLTIPEGVTSIGEYAFKDCSGFSGNLTIPESVTSIEYMAFEGCSGFSGSLTIPEGVTSIGGAAFEGCSGFSGNLTIPEGMTSIGHYAFSDCSGFSGSLTIPKGMTSIGTGAFKNCSGFSGSLTISEGVTSIERYAFGGCSGFSGSLIIPEGVTSIEWWAFEGCSGFNGSLTISESVTSIGNYAFSGCSGFSGSLTIPEGVTSIGEQAFIDCSGFNGSLTISESVTSIGDDAFSGCSGFSGSLTIPKGVTKIGVGVFSGCSGFSGSLTIPEGVISIEGYAFSGCSSFTGSLTFPDSVTSIGNSSFEDCAGFTGSLMFPDSVTSIGDAAFCGCRGFTDLVISNNVTSIGEAVFDGCIGFTGNLEIPNSVRSIGDEAFDGCCGFTGNLRIPESVTSIGASAFVGCIGFTGNLMIPDSVTSIGICAFDGCSGFTGRLTIPVSVTSINRGAFYDCKGFNTIVFEGNAPNFYDSDQFTNIKATVYYPSYRDGWDTAANKNYGGTLTWIPYAKGTEPWNMDSDAAAPQIYLLTTTTPQQMTYSDEGLDATEISLNLSALHMKYVIDDPVVYENAVVNITLPEGLSFNKNEQQQTLSKSIGTLDNVETKRVDLETITIYINPDQISEQYDICFEVHCDNYEKVQKSTYIIPVNFDISQVEEGIVNAVKKYASQEESEVLKRITSTYSGDELIQKLYEFYNCDNVFDLRDKITEWKDSYNERWSYIGLTTDEIYCSWQYYNYLNNTPKGIAARTSLAASGLVFNGELATWLDPGTYIDGDYPGIAKYKALLENFIDRQNTSVPHYSYVKETQKFVKGAVGLCTDVEKTEILKELDKSTDLVEAQSVFNDFIATKLPGSKKGEFTIVYEDQTLFSEAMGCTGKVFKIVNATVDNIASFVDVSGNLDTYETYRSFLYDIYESQELPWEMRIAAYQLIDEFTKEYYAPFENILKQLRDTCFDKALDATKMGNILNLNGYLTTLDFTAFCINKFVDIGSLVENSAYTEGYAILAMHYEDKLKACKSRFLADQTEQNAWEFYESYLMLWKLRSEGEKQWLAMNKLGGILGGVISESCSYSDKETTVNENLKLLESIRFKYDINNGTIPKDYQYLKKVVVECPVTVDIIALDGTVICTLPDREETEVINEYGRFITKYRPTTGDYVKIGYLYGGDSYTVSMTGQNSGDVECSIVTTEDHQNCEIKGFDKIQVDTGTIISIETEKEEYTVDQDGDGTAEIKAEIVDKEHLYVQFVDQISQYIAAVYANGDGYISMPNPPVHDKFIFEGWFTKPNGEGELFDGSVAIQSSLAVYAHWRNKTDGYIVTFDVMGHGTAPEPYREVKAGSVIEEPDAPTADGYTFTGWYKEEACENKWNFDIDVVQQDTVLYAGWKIKDTSGGDTEITYTVTFDTGNRCLPPSAYTDIIAGSKIKEPDSPIAEGYVFTGWYKEAGCKNKWNFAIDVVREDITLYAGWILEEDEEDGILPGDRPVSGEIPDGIWVAGIQDKTYTAAAVLQSFRVYDGNRLLKEKTDYTVSYKNNTKAYTLKDMGNPSAEDRKKAPQIVIKTKGNYAGSQTVYFNIIGRDISDETEFDTIDLITQYNKKKNIPMPTLTWNGKKLKSGTDFYVKEYEAEKSNKNAFIGTEKGNTTYELTLAGKGNFTGERKITLTVIGTWTADSLGSSGRPQILMNKIKVSKIPNQPYTGKAYTWEQLKQNIGGDLAFKVTYRDKVLEANVDYEILDIINSDKVGTAILRLRGLNTVAGQTGYSFVGIKEIPFKVTGSSINKARIYGLEKSYVYTGAEICPSVELVGIDAANYTVEYQNNKSVGRATVIVKGINACTGTKKATFKITGYPMDGSDIKVNGGSEAKLTAVYTKGGAKPDLKVSYGNRTLIEGKDYTLKYSNNKKIADVFAERAPMVTIRGKGDFSGSRALRYSITMADITQGVIMRANDVPENKKANKYQTKITLYDTDGKILKAGTDYDQKSVRYYVMENSAERALTAQDRPLAGTVITVKVKGKGNYGTGEISAVYRILPPNRDIAKAVFKIEKQPYTGRPITLTQQSQFMVDKNGNAQAYIKVGRQYTYLMLGKDFEVVENSYVKNVNKGKATVTLHGIGEYGGYKTVSFNIGTRSVSEWWKGLFS